MSIPKHRLELPPEAETARDFIEALVARYESQIEELELPRTLKQFILEGLSGANSHF